MSWMDHMRLGLTIVLLLLGGFAIVEIRKTVNWPQDKGQSPLRAAFRRLIRSKPAQFGGTVTYLVMLVSVLGPWLVKVTTGRGFDTTKLKLSKLPPAWWQWFGYKAEEYAPWHFVWGTDVLGRDLFVRCMVGTEVSIGVGLITTLVVLSIGVYYGAYAAKKGGVVDASMMRIVDVLYTLPFLTFVLVIMTLFGRNIVILFVAIGMTSWLTLSRIVRGRAMSLLKEAFVEAAVACGSSDRKILFLHVIRNTRGVVIIFITVIMPAVMLSESSLSFLSFGIQPPLASLGTLVSEGTDVMRYQPWLAVFPIVNLFIILFGINNLGDGARDAFDPKARGFEGRRQDKVTIRAGSVLGDPTKVLEVGNLSVEFDQPNGLPVRAVTDVSLSIGRSSIVAVVGESGCGKTTLGRAIMRLNPSPPSIVTEGTIRFGEHNLLTVPKSVMRKLRGDRIAMIFQDPQTALNPYHTIGRQLMEVFVLHCPKISRREARDRCVTMLSEVGISDSVQQMGRYPHELSGGMKQRVMIAMALLLQPDLIIADEPTTALDVTIQKQILRLLKDLRDQKGTAILLITHDLGIVAEMAENIVVMYAGRVVESGTVRGVFKNPQHPYTKGLLASIPVLEGERGRLAVIDGKPPELDKLPPGCPFFERCRDSGKHDGCKDEAQVFVPGRRVQCARKEVA